MNDVDAVDRRRLERFVPLATLVYENRNGERVCIGRDVAGLGLAICLICM